MKNTHKLGIYSLFGIHLLIVLFFWWSGSHILIGNGLDGTLLAIGRLCGILAVTFVLLQFLIMGRAPWIEKVYGLDKLSQFHKWSGYAAISFILVHPVLITISYAMSGRIPLLQQYIKLLTDYEDVLSADIAAMLFTFVVFSSIYIVRKHLRYEWWYAVHLLTYFAVLLAFGHQIENGGDFAVNQYFVYYWYFIYLFVFAHLVLFRFGRIAFNYFRFRFRVSRVVREAGNATSVYITGQNVDNFKIRPGQFLIFRFLDKKRWWQHHPFSNSYITHNNELRLTAKNLGDFTSEMGRIKEGTPVLIDGPYGSFTISPTEKQKYLFIAGGIGITPFRSLIEQVAPSNNIVLLYSNRTSIEFTLQKEIDELSQKYAFPVTYIVTQEDTYNGEKGRIDEEKIKRLVPDYKNREIYLCGPVLMMDGVKTILLALGVDSHKIHYEKFSLH